MQVNFNKRDPVYKQVIRHFKEQIATGAFDPGQEIPSRRELAGNLKINPNTVQRAYKEMEEMGLLYTDPNVPSRITKDEAILQSVREELIMEAVNDFVRSVRAIDVPIADVLDLVKKTYDNENGGDET